MVLPSMHDTCIKGAPDTVKNNFGSKNSKQLQGTAAAQIFQISVRFAWKSSVAVTVELG